MYFLFRSPKSRVVVLFWNGVLRSVTKVMVVPNSNLWNISVMRSSVTKSHCRIRARMANIGRFLSPNRLNAGWRIWDPVLNTTSEFMPWQITSEVEPQTQYLLSPNPANRTNQPLPSWSPGTRPASVWGGMHPMIMAKVFFITFWNRMKGVYIPSR